MTKERDPYFDNLKGLLICLVCLGHCVNIYKDSNIYCNYLFHLIYAFHMPLFFFISGYFSKNIERSYSRAFEALIVPAIPFELLYFILHVVTKADNMEPFLTPIFAYWFCFALFFCRALLPYLTRLRGIVIIAFVLALAAGFNPYINEIMSLSRFLCMLPFFMLGYYTTPDRMERIRNMKNLPVIFVGIVATAGVFAVLHYTDCDLGFTLRSPYTNRMGVIFRAFQFTMAFPLSLAVMRLVPVARSYLSVIGQRTLQIYFLHFYFITAIKMFNPVPADSMLNCMILLIAAPAIAAILAARPVSRCYNVLMNAVARLMII